MTQHRFRCVILARANRHKVFVGLAQWGKNSVGWYFGFKLHLVINDKGELLNFKLTPANTDERQPLAELVRGLIGKLFGDKGYISHKWFEQLFNNGLQLVTPSKKNMKNRLVPLIDKILLRKRSLIETVNDQLKNICSDRAFQASSYLQLYGQCGSRFDCL